MSKIMRWAGHLARMEERGGIYVILVGKSEGRIYLEDPGVDGKIIQKWIFEMCDKGDMDWTDLADDSDR
jgi:hypothetical protein